MIYTAMLPTDNLALFNEFKVHRLQDYPWGFFALVAFFKAVSEFEILLDLGLPSE